MTPKARKNQLIEFADAAVRSTLLVDGVVDGSYDGQISAFSVAVALSGLKTAMAIYMKSKSGSSVDRKMVIRMLAKMKDADMGTTGTSEMDLWNQVKNADERTEKDLKKAVLEYSIALKLTFRTFKYKNDERESS